MSSGRPHLAPFVCSLALGACARAAPPPQTDEAASSGADAESAVAAGPGALALARPFCEHMVLQRELPAPVWGRATPGASVRVRLADRASEARAGADGRWRAELSGLAPGGPFELVVTCGAAELRVRDVLVGEVWLCAGQSNMGMRMPQVQDSAREIAAAGHPSLRVFMVDKEYPREPAADVGGEWVVCSPECAPGLSATAYFFGRDLQRALDLPVGVIVSAVGGTGVESWMPRTAEDAVPELRPLLARIDALYGEKVALYEKTGTPEFYAKQHELALARWEEQRSAARTPAERAALGRRPKLVRHPLASKNHPGNLYNGMIAPLVAYGLRGVLWYQGEYNSGTSLETREAVEPELYALELTTLIASWRRAWGRELPFDIVQLSSWLRPQLAPVEDHGWALIREQQARVAASVPGTGLIVTLDAGDAENIHPPRKQLVGERLARLALHATYGRAEVEAAGPVLARSHAEGGTFVLEFEHANGLRTSDGAEPRGFALAGADHAWHWATARLEGARVVLSSAEVPAPVAARYAWAANPRANLVNAAGLPAGSFRTDDWPIELVETPLPAHFEGEEDE